MVSWKREILNRAGAPKATEELFNKAWDACSDWERHRLVDKPKAIEADFRALLVSHAEFAIDTSERQPRELTAVQRGCLHAEYGHPDWLFFWEPVMEKYHITHTMKPMPLEERRARCQEILDFCAHYDPSAVAAVLYGYPIDEVIPRELGGGVRNKRDYKECIQYVDYWFGIARPKPVAVTEFRGIYAPFSNFHRCKIVMDCMEFPSVENAFQAAKTLRMWERKQFQFCSPAEAKRKGFHIQLREDWERAKVEVMRLLLKQKFAPGTELHALLMSTKGMEICEGNTWHDNFWGACRCGRCADKPHGNMLGKLLMELRDAPVYNLEAAKQVAVKDLFSLIFPEDWEAALQSPELCKAIYNWYPCTGLLVQHNSPATLYHLTSPEAADAIISGGFSTDSASDKGTYGGDVVYAYESLSTFRTLEGYVPLKVQVSRYMRAATCFDKDPDLENECIFFPKDVLSVERAQL